MPWRSFVNTAALYSCDDFYCIVILVTSAQSSLPTKQMDPKSKLYKFLFTSINYWTSVHPCPIREKHTCRHTCPLQKKLGRYFIALLRRQAMF